MYVCGHICLCQCVYSKARAKFSFFYFPLKKIIEIIYIYFVLKNLSNRHSVAISSILKKLVRKVISENFIFGEWLVR